jgi:tyrosine-protein phosphatase non-receptor type 13 protein
MSSIRHVPVIIILYLFQVVVISEGLEDNFLLGLAALLGGDFALLPHKTKLRKVAPVGWHGNSKKDTVPGCTFTLYLRVKFFMPSLRGVRYVSAASTLHTSYLFI